MGNILRVLPALRFKSVKEPRRTAARRVRQQPACRRPGSAAAVSSYTVVVTNALGSVTSSPANITSNIASLTINTPVTLQGVSLLSRRARDEPEPAFFIPNYRLTLMGI